MAYTLEEITVTSTMFYAIISDNSQKFSITLTSPTHFNGSTSMEEALDRRTEFRAMVEGFIARMNSQPQSCPK